jgi:3,4-dihydroxy-2-butanone 4-phosphate synthase
VYLIYYTDKESREKNQDQIIAAKKISKTEIDLNTK